MQQIPTPQFNKKEGRTINKTDKQPKISNSKGQVTKKKELF